MALKESLLVAAPHCSNLFTHTLTVGMYASHKVYTSTLALTVHTQ